MQAHGCSAPLLIVVTGPTASGKTAVAAKLARRLHTEVISADSRQIYRGIPIATAAPTPEDMRGVPHHLVGTLPLDHYLSAATFASEARALAEDIFSRCSGVAVVCGGSIMYIRALLGQLDEIPTISPQVRAHVDGMLATPGGLERLRIRLLGLDPEYYRTVDLLNPRRVAHAVEVCLQAGVPYSSLRTRRQAELPFRVVQFVMQMPRERLYERIDSRVDAMVEAGLESEARAVAHLQHLNSLNTVGLKEMFEYLDGRIPLSRAMQQIKKNTRVYARKQITLLSPRTIESPSPSSLKSLKSLRLLESLIPIDALGSDPVAEILSYLSLLKK